MKKFINIILIIAFALMNCFSFIGCKPVTAKGETVACWIASIGNLDFPSDQGLSADALKKEIDAIVSNCKIRGINTVFFQVRPNGDALYKSDVFPWSVYLSGKQGVAPDKEFDPLAYFTEKAHDAEIELHAWINPYRIGTGENVWAGLSADNPAVLNKEYTVTTASGVYYDPGLPEARRLIIQGVAEIVKNYDVDGIHFDDYFYPYDLTGFDDSNTYKKYGKGRSLADFRRQSVDELVENIYKTVKTIKKNVEFGISPFGIWANQSVDTAGSNTSGMSSYAEIYSDSKNWVEEGWLDYICPQLYWSFDHEAAPYGVLVDWWSDLCTKNKMKLYIGLGLYKMGTDEIGWDDPDLIQREIAYAAGKKAYAGHCFFSYQTILENPLRCLDKVFPTSATASKNEDTEEMKEEQKVITIPSGTELKITSPQSGSTVQGKAISVTGIAKAGESVTVNGKSATVSSKGLFTAYVPLEYGTNQIKVSSGGVVKNLNIKRSRPENAAQKLDGESLYPSGEVARNSGDTIQFQINGPENAQVHLENSLVKIPLNEIFDGVYQGEWTVPQINGDKLSLNEFQCISDKDGVSEMCKVDLSLLLYGTGYSEEVILQKDAYLFDKSNGGSQMDHAPLPQGYRLRVIGKEGSRSLLENGYWIETETIGTEKVNPLEPCSYDYKVVTIPIEIGTVISHEFKDNQLEIILTNGRNDAYSYECDPELKVEYDQNAYQSILMISGRNGETIAGYEIFPQKKQLTLYLHFKTGSLEGKTIVLDPGHGGSDRGALSAGGEEYPTESAMNLSLALRLKETLEREGAEILLLRAEDTELKLDERFEIAVAKSADLYISLHHNSTAQTNDFTKPTGGSVHYSSPVSKPFAEVLSQNLWKELREDAKCRVVKQSLRVCRQTRYPAVLIEAGYVCNPLEYEFLCTEETQQQLCENILSGLKLYFES